MKKNKLGSTDGKGNTNLPPVMSKLTFSQLTDNAEEFNKSISLM